MNIRTHYLLIFIVGIFSCLNSFAQENTSKFDRSAYYAAMGNDKLAPVDAMLSTLKHLSFDNKNAFEGALLMKKAGLISGLNAKLSTFKDGNKKLEGAISKNSSNAEYRFLRLMIQENAPGILNYSSNEKEDRDMIVKSYKSLPESVQNAILDYCKHSKILTASDFN